MTQPEKIDILELEMIGFNQNDPKRIHHLIKVHRFAQLIGRMEQLDAHTQFVTECAALVHDIGSDFSKNLGRKEVFRFTLTKNRLKYTTKYSIYTTKWPFWNEM